MRHAFVILATALAVIGSLVPAAPAADKIRVVATIPDLKALRSAATWSKSNRSRGGRRTPTSSRFARASC